MPDPVDRHLDQVEAGADDLGRALSQLAHALLRGEGRPYAHELTPDQANRLAETLARLGSLGALILEADLALTAAREGVADRRAPPRPD